MPTDVSENKNSGNSPNSPANLCAAVPESHQILAHHADAKWRVFHSLSNTTGCLTSIADQRERCPEHRMRVSHARSTWRVLHFTVVDQVE